MARSVNPTTTSPSTDPSGAGRGTEGSGRTRGHLFGQDLPSPAARASAAMPLPRPPPLLHGTARGQASRRCAGAVLLHARPQPVLPPLLREAPGSRSQPCGQEQVRQEHVHELSALTAC